MRTFLLLGLLAVAVALVAVVIVILWLEEWVRNLEPLRGF